MTGELASRRFSGGDLGRLLLGPLVYAGGIAVWWLSDRLLVIGPFDRAQIGWLLVVPMLALGPGLAGLAEAVPHLAQLSRRLALATAVITGVSVAAWIATNTTQVGCRPVTSPLDVLWQSIVTGVLASLAFFGGYVVAAAQASDHPLAAVVGGAVTWLVIGAADVLLLLVVLFPALSCAPPQGL